MTTLLGLQRPHHFYFWLRNLIVVKMVTANGTSFEAGMGDEATD